MSNQGSFEIPSHRDAVLFNRYYEKHHGGDSFDMETNTGVTFVDDASCCDLKDKRDEAAPREYFSSALCLLPG